MANLSSAKPKFCFIHIVAPHPPYVFDRNGQLRTRRQFSEHSWEPKEHYTEQMEYVNKQVGNFIASVRAKNPKAVIVLQSDHGPWVTAGSADAVFEARSGVLYAWYGPAGIHIPDKSSPVNTFVYLFNGLYKTSLPVLPDSAVGKKALMQDPILLKKVQG
jgi:arylsulfatase A-like enzyme